MLKIETFNDFVVSCLLCFVFSDSLPQREMPSVTSKLAEHLSINILTKDKIEEKYGII